MKKIILVLFITAIVLGCASTKNSDVSSGINNSASDSIEVSENSRVSDSTAVTENSNESSSTVTNESSRISSEGGNTEPVNNKSIFDTDWVLTDVYINGVNTQFGRTSRINLDNYFTLYLDAQNISGYGAPNRYSAPYTIGENQTISILPMRSTMMAALFEPENLKEHDFFNYVQKSTAWQVVNEKLEFYSKTDDGRDVRLVFSLNK
ncbi:MAG: META domain-containing protein [Treponema sp.]|nr:META domain-containing protein [Treponema sp.]